MSAKKISNNQHVLPNSSGGWAVKREGATKNSKIVKTQAEAIIVARNRAIDHKSELFIHSKTGRIRERNTYGKDYYPPKG